MRSTGHFKLALVLGVACSAATLHAAETRDLILVAGQSNAVGFDAKPSKLPADAADAEIMFWWRCGDPPPDARDSTSGGKWSHLQAQPLGDPRPPHRTDNTATSRKPTAASVRKLGWPAHFMQKSTSRWQS